MNKHQRMQEMIAGFASAEEGVPPEYAGFFKCFNRAEYFEAHDVLEHLWLRTNGPDHAFYKGLIQVAGAFVHLKKQCARPDHPKDGRRLHPAARLFALAHRHLAPFAPRHHRLDVGGVLLLCRAHIEAIEQSEFAVNPWSPARPSQITLDHHG